MPNIPFQHRVTIQILKHWQTFRDLKLTFVVSRRAEQFRLRTQKRIVATAEDSVLRTEMDNLESQEEDAPKCVLWFKTMSWNGVLSHGWVHVISKVFLSRTKQNFHHMYVFLM